MADDSTTRARRRQTSLAWTLRRRARRTDDTPQPQAEGISNTQQAGVYGGLPFHRIVRKKSYSAFTSAGPSLHAQEQISASHPNLTLPLRRMARRPSKAERKRHVRRHLSWIPTSLAVGTHGHVHIHQSVMLAGAPPQLSATVWNTCAPGRGGRREHAANPTKYARAPIPIYAICATFFAVTSASAPSGLVHVSKILEVTTYGSQLELGRRSSR